MPKNIRLRLIIILSAVIYLFTIGPDSIYIIPQQVSEESNADSLVVITLSAVGDLMCHSVQFNYAEVKDDSFDFNPVYREIKKYFINSDFLFGNLETVTAGRSKGYSGYPFFNTPDQFITALKNAGFDLLTTSNNHSLDRGEKGVIRTIEVIKKNNLNYNGTFTSQADRDSIRIFNIKGINIAFLAYTYGTNGNPVPKGKSYLINLINPVLVERDIKEARSKGADIVLVHYHFGEEYLREPAHSQRETVRRTIEAGADLIIGGHPHVLQPADFFKTINAGLDTGFVIYCLGNFISNQRWRYSDAGVILNIIITRDLRNDSIYVSGVNYIPTWVFKGSTGRGSEYVILPSLPGHTTSIDDYLSENDLNLIKQSFEDSRFILTKYTDRIRLFRFPPLVFNIEPRAYYNKEPDLKSNFTGESLFYNDIEVEEDSGEDFREEIKPGPGRNIYNKGKL